MVVGVDFQSLCDFENLCGFCVELVYFEFEIDWVSE